MARGTNTMGGSLADPVTCADNSGITTPYSEKTVNFEDDEYQFVDLFTNYDQKSMQFSRARLFMKTADYLKIEGMIDPKDNLKHQCLNSKACLETDDSFMKQLSFVYYVEEHFD